MDLLGGESSESESEGLNLDNDYAAKYDNWRGKEHMQRLRDKYGDQVQVNEEEEEDESSSEEEDEDAEELTPDVEKAFFATMASLKSKDPALYDGKTTFFKAKDASEGNTKSSQKKGEKITISDMERKIMLEKGGQYEDEEMKGDPHTLKNEQLSYNEELNSIKASFQNELNSENENDNEDFLTKRSKTKQETQEEDEDYKLWLAGQKSNVDETVKEKMGGLRDYWNENKLDEGEKFLKDYLLNKRYLDKDDDGYVPSYDEIVHDSDEDLSEDERNVEKQEEFEHKFNFRFEEPDEEFIKRYPRTVKDSLRREDDKRKNKRKEVEERKKQEKETKKEEIRMLKNMKKKEIMDKIAKIRSLTGNEELEMDEDDIEGDFDPVKYDKKMQEIFKNYDENTQDDEKPTFSDLDDDLDGDNYGEDFEDWDNWTGGGATSGDGGNIEAELHCEDEDFNMDCDFDKEDHQKEIVESTKRKKGRRKSKFTQALEKSSDKPVFDPNDKTFSEYVDEYYKLDAEDHIGDIACRFRYRNVQQNDFGLSTEEILAAKDSELNAWASLRKTCQYRNEDDERKDFHVYRNKSKDANLKKKLLPSIYENPDGQAEASAESGHKPEGADVEKVVIGNKKKKLGKKERQKKRKALGLTEVTTSQVSQAKKMRLNENTTSEDQPSVICHKKKKKKKGKGAVSKSVDNVQTNAAYQADKKNPGKNKSVPDKQESELSKISDDRLKAYGVNPNQVKRKLKSAKFKNAVKQAS